MLGETQCRTNKHPFAVLRLSQLSILLAGGVVTNPCNLISCTAFQDNSRLLCADEIWLCWCRLTGAACKETHLCHSGTVLSPLALLLLLLLPLALSALLWNEE